MVAVEFVILDIVICNFLHLPIFLTSYLPNFLSSIFWTPRKSFSLEGASK
jgi:hypothetical protein